MLLLFNETKAQTQEQILKEFYLSENDSIFLAKRSLDGYKVYTLDLGLIDSNDILTQVILNNISDKNHELKYETNSYLYYIKLVSFDSAYMVHAGNIWISGKRGRQESMRLANIAKKEIDNGKSYNSLCQLYSDDQKPSEDCDLGWFFNTVMVKEFGNEVIKHKKNEIFVVETEYGFHVVKMFDNPYKAVKSIKYVVLTMKKE